MTLGDDLPDGTRFIGPKQGATSNWPLPDAPTSADLDLCVACGLCLPQCPTYRLTGEESASPRGRITAMRAISEGTAQVDETFASFMDLCLSCRACEDVCPSHVPFGRMMEHARVEIEPLRSAPARGLRRLGLDVALPRRWLLSTLYALTPVAKPFLPRRVRSLVPRGRRGARVAERTDPPEGVEHRGTVAIVTGCVQDQWYRAVNRATARVLARNGWRVLAPRAQTCCGALGAHYGRLESARDLARENLAAFDGADVVVVNSAGCGAHMKEYGSLLGHEEGAVFGSRVRDLMEFLDEQGIRAPSANPGIDTVAYHDACHALRAQGIHAAPRKVLGAIPNLEIVELEHGDRCCGAAGLYNVLEPEMSGELRSQKVDAVLASGAQVVASANPGCTMQIVSGLRDRGADVEVVHPVELLDRAYAAEEI